MATRAVKDFGTMYGANVSHEGAESLKTLVGQQIVVHDCDFGRSRYGKVTNLLIGEEKENAKWYYTTSGVILSQLTEVMEKSPFPFKATLVERKDYLCLE